MCRNHEGDLNLLQVNAGGRHTLALGADNRLWAFGDNSEGQLGRDSQQECSSHPVLVQGLPDSAVVQFVVAGGQLAGPCVSMPNQSSSLHFQEHTCVHYKQAKPVLPVCAAVIEHAQRNRVIKFGMNSWVQCTKKPQSWHGEQRLKFATSLPHSGTEVLG